MFRYLFLCTSGLLFLTILIIQPNNIPACTKYKMTLSVKTYLPMFDHLMIGLIWLNNIIGRCLPSLASMLSTISVIFISLLRIAWSDPFPLSSTIPVSIKRTDFETFEMKWKIDTFLSFCYLQNYELHLHFLFVWMLVRKRIRFQGNVLSTHKGNTVPVSTPGV